MDCLHPQCISGILAKHIRFWDEGIWTRALNYLVKKLFMYLCLCLVWVYKCVGSECVFALFVGEDLFVIFYSPPYFSFFYILYYYCDDFYYYTIINVIFSYYH